MNKLRADLQIISEWITPGSRVMDLGCGDGTLLKHLKETRKVKGYGLEIDIDNIVKCVKSGVNVIQADLDEGLSDFEGEPFDFVVMTQALQAVKHPDRLLNEMLRVGREGIVTFPNFGHISARLQLALGGHMPVTKTLPSEWYNTPNIHLCTLTDFERLCRNNGIHILERTVVDRTHRAGLGMKLLPNLLGEIAIYRFKRK
jgi:methionine biosynthesis protein MetW